MNGSIFRRVVWKEYRQIRSFWIAIFLFDLMLLAIVAACTLSARSVPTEAFFSIGLAFPAFYALGIGATLFATEHETGTYAFLRALPTSAGQQLLGRLVFAVASVAAMFVACWLAALVFSRGTLPGAADHLTLWVLWGCIAMELLLWGTLFSLLTKNPLTAAGLGVPAAILSVWLVCVLSARFDRPAGPETYLTSLTPQRLAVAAMLALAIVGLGLRWFREERTAGGVGQGDAALDGVGSSIIAGRSRPSVATALGRLAWQQYRQTRKMSVVLIAMVAPAGLCILATLLFDSQSLKRLGEILPFGDAWLVLIGLSAVFAAPLSGVVVFHTDQRRQGIGFLGERGASPTLVWLSRHAVSFALPLLVLLGIGLGNVVLWANVPNHADAARDALQAVMRAGCVCGVLVLAYVFGQLCSMFFKSGVIAGFLAFAGIVAWCFWAGLMDHLEISWLWSVAPVAPVLLAATWLRTSSWMLARNKVRDWAPTVGLLVGFVATTLVAVCLYRIHEIPDTEEFGVWPEKYAAEAKPEALETSALYARANELLQPISARPIVNDEQDEPAPESKKERIARETEWLEANRQPLAILLETSRRQSCDAYLDPTGGAKWAAEHEASQLGFLLATQAEHLQADGQLDKAVEYYTAALRFSAHARQRNRWPRGADWVELRTYDDLVTWAAEPNQTPEQIRAVIESLDELIRQAGGPDEAIKSEYVWQSRLLSDDMASLDLSQIDPTMLSMVRWLPWERARARRLLNYITACNIAIITRTGQIPPDDQPTFDREEAHLESLLTRTLVLNSSFSDRNRSSGAGFRRMTESRRTAAELRLALAAWRLEHGQLPDSLEPVIAGRPGRWFTDPWSGEPFRYFPEGVEGELDCFSYSGGEDRTGKLAPGEPFVWSVGPFLQIHQGYTDPRQRYYDQQGPGQGIRFGTEMEIWRRGHAYPIP